MKIKLLKLFQRKNANKIRFLLLLATVSISCSREPKMGIIGDNYPHGQGFTLQRFDVIDLQLDSLINAVLDFPHFKEESGEVKVPLLYLNKIESQLQFGFVSVYKDVVSTKHIFNCFSTRIVGYMNTSQETLIILSNVSCLLDFEINFYQFIRPTSDTEYIDYVYFPKDLYVVDEIGGAPPSTLYDPYYYWYVYEDNGFVFCGNDHGH